MLMECSRCKSPIAEGESCTYMGKILCEDCFVQAVEPRKTCDVAAVHAAKTHKESSGQTGTKGLTDEQKRIYEYIQRNHPVTAADLAQAVDLPLDAVENHLTTLRHCELTKGRKIGNKVCIVPFYLD